jgi:uncharacterized protein
MNLPTSRFHPRLHALAGLGAAALAFLVLHRAAAQEPRTEGDKVSPVVPIQAEPFPLADVRLLDGPFRDAMLRDQKYLLSLDPDRLLHTFRLNVGLPSTAQPLGGWEEPKCELRGHSLGHYLSALALMYASTGDARFKDRAASLVAELAKCQAAAPKAGFHEGYLSAFPESFIDRVEQRKPVWAPWYTLHKIMAGLLDTYQLCGDAQALQVLEKMAGWVKYRVDHLTPAQMQAALDTEFGGMNEVLSNLYSVTGNQDYLTLAQAFDHQKVFGPLALREDRLNGLHANTQIPKMIGAAREYELTGDPRYLDIAQTFWDRVALHRSYAIGGHSDGEHFFPIADFARHLGPDTCETCNTYNMLKLTRHLFALAPGAPAMDFYERALYNHILASQDPQQGMFVYLMSLKPGHFKTYSTPEDSFWCCVGTGMENHAKYADTIYFHDADSLYINLFIASELKWPDHGLVLRQETKFPASDTTRLTIKCEQPLEGNLKIRYPAWARSRMTLTVNGVAQDYDAVPGSYVTLHREWRDGDVVEVRLPMSLRVEPLPGEDNVVALCYGPLVLAGELGTNAMPNPYAHHQTDFSKLPSPEAPVFVVSAENLLSHIEPVASQPLTFRSQGIGRPADVTFIPFYQLHHQRYSVYWKLLSETAWKDKAAERAAAAAKRMADEARVVDSVQPGEQQPETDHQFRGEQTRTGEFNERKWRDAPDGWFSYQVKVLPDAPMSLVCTYWGSDAGQREFDILADGVKLATQKLDNARPGEFFEVEHRLPVEMTRAKQHITVKFQALPGHTAGGLFGLRTVKTQP